MSLFWGGWRLEEGLGIGLPFGFGSDPACITFLYTLAVVMGTALPHSAFPAMEDGTSPSTLKLFSLGVSVSGEMPSNPSFLYFFN